MASVNKSKPKEESIDPISPNLDEVALSVNDEDTTKTQDETAMLKSQKRDDIQNKFDGTYEDQLERLNDRVKILSTELAQEKEKFQSLERKCQTIKTDRDKLKRAMINQVVFISRMQDKYNENS
ncbi:hypothetical protein ACO0OL_003900 [Hanseniaspora opuntiae]|uniref:Uncharacterized protein n=1 Tax=Hanseniaspora opuntiae TaxID=211096 RepID=A0A1E5RKN8_9ASCO|nr:hypothetical protein AWRI3578_g1780 [Hanseniaspora opuntiae]